ncbi:MAG: S53 family peptidase, partial [Nocardioidaceae bacterium]
DAATARPACATPQRPHRARCFALVRTDLPHQHLAPDEPPAGYGPTDLWSAYHLGAAAAARGDGETVAIVDAYHNPNLVEDLATYRSTFGLPPCSTESGCLRIVNQRGVSGSPPPKSRSWGLEASLDVDMVSAICPHCRILLVEADSNTVSDLALATGTAARLGASVISNSYGADELTGMSKLRPFYDPADALVVAASGDGGFGVAQEPAVFANVMAVGGTRLSRTTNARGWVETVWGHGGKPLTDGAGSGCSAYVDKPAWQHDGHCHMRTVADISAVADPDTGVAVYDSFRYGGWLVAGGTSASAPIIAGVAGLAGTGGTHGNGFLYHHHKRLNDPVKGSNGRCGGDYLCLGKPGYDAPSGLGTPNGLAGFCIRSSTSPVSVSRCDR